MTHRDEALLLEILERFPQGASLEEVLLGLGPIISRRTLQRWLAKLVAVGTLAVSGKARARRYRVIHTREEKSSLEIFIPLSHEAISVELEVCKPFEMRLPVTYRKEFLETYHPNNTFYLPSALRQQLAELGKSNGNVPIGTYARKIFSQLLIDLSWNSSRLEGNTYSLLETERLLEKGLAAKGKDLRETQMILNHKIAIEFLVYSVEDLNINRYTLLNLHTLLADNLLSDPAACGRLRTIPVGISHSIYRPSSIPQVIEECFQKIIEKASAIEDPFEQAFFLMVQLPYLQPFDDVNKRTSRLAANIPFIRKNLCPLSFIDVPEKQYIHGLLGVYELNRIELMRDLFAWAYERSCKKYLEVRQILGEPDPFRMEMRELLQETVRTIVLQLQNQEQSIQEIRNRALQLPEQKRNRFIQLAEQELLSLHEGNISRYRLRPSEFEHWIQIWH